MESDGICSKYSVKLAIEQNSQYTRDLIARLIESCAWDGIGWQRKWFYLYQSSDVVILQSTASRLSFTQELGKLSLVVVKKWNWRRNDSRGQTENKKFRVILHKTMKGALQ